ncbi:MurR/RpiR family transcriptional regulator [Streptomyces sp. NPDC059627]
MSIEAWLAGRTARGSLGPQAERVVHVLVRAPQFAGYASAREVAERAGVNVSTVVRTAQQFGFDGWPQLREELRARYLASVSAGELSESPAADPAAQTLRQDAANLAALATPDTLAAIRATARAVRAARRTLVISSGSGGGAAPHHTARRPPPRPAHPPPRGVSQPPPPVHQGHEFGLGGPGWQTHVEGVALVAEHQVKMHGCQPAEGDRQADRVLFPDVRVQAGTVLVQRGLTWAVLRFELPDETAYFTTVRRIDLDLRPPSTDRLGQRIPIDVPSARIALGHRHERHGQDLSDAHDTTLVSSCPKGGRCCSRNGWDIMLAGCRRAGTMRLFF